MYWVVLGQNVVYFRTTDCWENFDRLLTQLHVFFKNFAVLFINYSSGRFFTEQKVDISFRLRPIIYVIKHQSCLAFDDINYE